MGLNLKVEYLIYIQKNITLNAKFPQHTIIQIHNNVQWNWQYYVEYSIIQTKCEEYSA